MTTPVLPSGGKEIIIQVSIFPTSNCPDKLKLRLKVRVEIISNLCPSSTIPVRTIYWIHHQHKSRFVPKVWWRRAGSSKVSGTFASPHPKKSQMLAEKLSSTNLWREGGPMIERFLVNWSSRVKNSTIQPRDLWRRTTRLPRVRTCLPASSP